MDRWQREIKIVLALTFFALLLSYFVGHLTEIFLIISLILLIRQSLIINDLELWLSRGAFRDYRDRKGIWSDIYYHLWKIKKTDKKRKKKAQSHDRSIPQIHRCFA